MKLHLLDNIELDSFPSGSGIEFFNDRLYLVGDDAKEILVLNKRWKEKERITLFTNEETRIPKKEKADLEATTVLVINDSHYLLVLGSGSKDPRNKAIILEMANKEITTIDISYFYERLKSILQLTEINIEGAALVNNYLVLANRGNKTFPDNHLIVTTPLFWQDQANAPVQIHQLNFSEYEGPIGISGLCYSEHHEQLLFTTSMEDTPNGYDDGAIGKSYLGIINNIFRKLGRPHEKLSINELIDLPATSKKFEGYKIESLCIQSEKDHSIKLHLVADNDNGKSYLFKVQLKW
jgi:hypothetical protein